MGRRSPFDPLPRIEPPHKSILQKEVYLKHKYDSSALLQPFNVSPFKVQVARNSLKVRLTRLINKGQGLKPRGALTPKPSLTQTPCCSRCACQLWARRAKVVPRPISNKRKQAFLRCVPLRPSRALGRFRWPEARETHTSLRAFAFQTAGSQNLDNQGPTSSLIRST